MSRLEGIETKEFREVTAKATVEAKSGTTNDALLRLAVRLRERADAIEREVDTARSVMAP